MTIRQKRIAVVGAGIGGLVTALDLASSGAAVTVFESASFPGGKMRQTALAGARIDAGPTVLTMPWVFEDIFRRAGAALQERVALTPLDVLARHAWGPNEHLDLFSDEIRTSAAIAAFAGGREADGYRRFCKRSAEIYATLEEPFIRNGCASPQALVAALGLRGLPALWRIAPFTTMHSALRAYFKDPRLVQLFGRYATYCGSSPFLAPATLMLVAHVEQQGVWSVDGGMHGLAVAVEQLARERGVTFRYGEHVQALDVAHGRVRGVVLSSGEQVTAETVVVNSDSAALGNGLFGKEAARAIPSARADHRSLSAMTWAVVAKTDGFALARHNVFFSNDYALEFDQILRQHRLPSQPTVYVCAQDRMEADDNDAVKRTDSEALLCLVNAPASDHARAHTDEEISRCKEATFQQMEHCGLKLDWRQAPIAETTPAQFASRYPGTGGALYGPASHGWAASFRRNGARTKIAGLYLAGGSTHPGPGVPMAALSGTIAARAILEDHVLTSPLQPTAMRGGISTPSVTIKSTRSR